MFHCSAGIFNGQITHFGAHVMLLERKENRNWDYRPTRLERVVASATRSQVYVIGDFQVQVFHVFHNNYCSRVEFKLPPVQRRPEEVLPCGTPEKHINSSLSQSMQPTPTQQASSSKFMILAIIMTTAHKSLSMAPPIQHVHVSTLGLPVRISVIKYWWTWSLSQQTPSGHTSKSERKQHK